MRPVPANRTPGGTVVPASLLDVQMATGEIHYWSDRNLSNIPAVITADGNPANVSYLPWLMGAPTFTWNRSTQTDIGSLTLQNITGDTLYRDFERIATRSALEGSLFVYRYWDVAGEFAWIENHGTITIDPTERRLVTIKTQQLVTGSDETPGMTYSETCQLVWGEKRCGADTTAPGAAECKYSYQTCQVVEHFVGTQTSFELNFTESTASVLSPVINRRRSW